MTEQTDQKQTARQIAIDAGVLTPCKACGVVTQAPEVATAEAYKLANTEFSRGLYHDIFPDRRFMTDAVKIAIEAADKTCTCGTPTSAKPVAPFVTKPAAPAFLTARPATPRDAALAAVGSEHREALLRKASDLGVHGTDDVVWALVASVIDATAAAQAAGDAAAATAASVASIKNEIYQGAAKAAADVKATIETSITGTVNAAISSAAQAGADALRKAAADLPKVAQAEQGRIVQEWKAALASAARDSVFAGFFQRLSVNIAVLVILVGGIFVGGAVSGAAGIETIMRAQHRLTPPEWRLLVNQNGKLECGTLAGHEVCLARKTRHPT